MLRPAHWSGHGGLPWPPSSTAGGARVWCKSVMVLYAPPPRHAHPVHNLCDLPQDFGLSAPVAVQLGGYTLGAGRKEHPHLVPGRKGLPPDSGCHRSSSAAPLNCTGYTWTVRQPSVVVQLRGSPSPAQTVTPVFRVPA